MRRLELALGAVCAIAALALPATASATDYCVSPASNCTAPNTFPASATGVQAALDAAGVATDADRVFLGAARYVSPAISGFQYDHQTAPVELIGQGAGATTLGGTANTTLQSLAFRGTAASEVRDMTIEVPWRDNGSFPTALSLFSTARNIVVVPDPTGAVNVFGANAVQLSGGTFLGGSVTVPTAGSFSAIGTNAANNTVRGSTLEAHTPLNITSDNATLSRLRVTGGAGSNALSARAIGVTLSDSTIVQPGASIAATANNGNTTDAAITLDHDTIVGDNSGGSIGVYAGATTANGHNASVTMHDTILRGFAIARQRGDVVGTAAFVTTAYSDYAGTTATVGGGGAGAFTEGAGIVNVDPAFVNPSAGPSGDYRLTAGSPAIDIGDPADVLANDPVDLLGLPRIVEGNSATCVLRSDMGAFEFQAKPTANAALVGAATAGSPASFDGSASTEPYGLALTYAWSFDDGGTATGATPQHTFATSGPHSATLTVTGPCAGHTDANVANFTVADAPTPPDDQPPVVTPPDVTPPAAQPPDTTITSLPKKKVRKRATFSFESSQPGSSFSCSLDAKAPAPCTSPVTYRKLKRGRHTFAVFATNTAGTPDSTPASQSFKVKRHKRP